MAYQPRNLPTQYIVDTSEALFITFDEASSHLRVEASRDTAVIGSYPVTVTLQVFGFDVKSLSETITINVVARPPKEFIVSNPNDLSQTIVIGQPWSLIIPQLDPTQVVSGSELSVNFNGVNFIVFDPEEKTLYLDSLQQESLTLGDFTINIHAKAPDGTLSDPPLSIELSVQALKDYLKENSGVAFPEIPLPKNRVRTKFQANAVLEIKFSRPVGWNMDLIDQIVQ